jgi:AcrR family transcriptional regulator
LPSTAAVHSPRRTPPRRRIAANIKDSALVEARRDRLVDAAIEVFLEKGFHAATTRDVTLRANVAQGTLYNYVRTKEDILYLVCDRAVTHYHQAVVAAIAGIDDPRERLVRAVRASVRSQYEHRANIALVMRSTPALDPASRRAVRARADAFFDEMLAIVDAGLPAARKRRGSVRMLAELVTYLPTIFAMRPWRVEPEGSAERAIEAVVETIFAALGVEE